DGVDIPPRRAWMDLLPRPEFHGGVRVHCGDCALQPSDGRRRDPVRGRPGRPGDRHSAEPFRRPCGVPARPMVVAIAGVRGALFHDHAVWWTGDSVHLLPVLTVNGGNRAMVNSDTATAAAPQVPTDINSARRPRVIVVMPAYNAGRTLTMTYKELPHDTVDMVIVVDDASKDDTVAVARDLNLKLFVHNRNYGYGANQKTCYAEALRAGAEVVVMVHPDYQYDPRLLPDLLAPLLHG